MFDLDKWDIQLYKSKEIYDKNHNIWDFPEPIYDMCFTNDARYFSEYVVLAVNNLQQLYV